MIMLVSHIRQQTSLLHLYEREDIICAHLWNQWIDFNKTFRDYIVITIMNRKIKQWPLIIAPISTKQTTTSLPKSLKTKKTMTYEMEIQVLAWDRHKNYHVNQFNRIPTIHSWLLYLQWQSAWNRFH